jgi:hypothetical protein
MHPLSIDVLRGDARDIRRRLIRPPNAVPDRGINLRRDTSLPPPKKRLPSPMEAGWLPAMFVILDAIRKLKELKAEKDESPIGIKSIIAVVARHYGVKPIDLVSHRRTANIVIPRQVAMYLAKTVTLRSLPFIGRHFGGRDHTTVLHSVRKIAWMVEHDPDFAAEIEKLRASLS